MPVGTLYIVATPIGNLNDITLRALEVLKSIDVVLCEDTRLTRRLLRAHGIEVKTESYHAHSKAAKTDKILGWLEEKRDLALVSDAGTPGISDPGGALVKEIREKLPSVRIVAIPGASALTAALAGSGLPADEFTFYGFLPHKKGRETKLKELAQTSGTAVVYESPYRVIKMLTRLSEVLKEYPEGKNRTVVVAREISKVYEEFVSGTADEVIRFFENHPDKLRGEFVIMMGPAR